MAITPKLVKRIALSIFIGFIVLFTLIIFSILYESKKDISNQLPYSKYLDIPLEVKVPTTIRWNKTNLRFSNYSLAPNETSNFDSEDLKSVKTFQLGDTILFHAAKTYYSIHVDRTYYLIGRDTLPSGKIIEFEHFYSGEYNPVFRNDSLNIQL